MKQNLFTQVKATHPPRNSFDLSHDVKLSMDMGELIPILAMECVPGDRIRLACNALIRMAPLVAPIMHRVRVYTHTFFVPMRLLWANWEKFITSWYTTDPPPAFPYLTLDKDHTSIPRLADYLGIPNPELVAAAADMKISAFPFAAYQFIYKEYYRDQNIENPFSDIYWQLADGSNGLASGGAPASMCTLQKRAWQHDYFTSALPFAQKGDPVSLNIAGFSDVPVKANDLIAPATGSIEWPVTGQPGAVALTETTPRGNYDGTPNIAANALYAETSLMESQSVTINQLRIAVKLQEFLEKDARGGTRYIEHIRSHFGVSSSDKRLQRPEYVTGTFANVVISEVLNTTGTEDNPQGNMAGHGISVTQGKYGNYYCEEHGYLITVMSILPDTAYQQGIPKHFLKIDDPLQFYFPSFAHLGEQEILNKELYAWGTNQDGVFGYIPRYSEYKYLPSRVCGDFRTTLKHWHMGRIFASQPSLNSSFIKSDPTKRIFAVTDGPQSIWAQAVLDIRASRLMPKFGTPTF